MHSIFPLKLTPTLRIRRSPFWEGVESAGVKACSVYNHMLFPTIFDTLDDDYRHLKSHVQVWDVGCQRQVELRGPDSAMLAQMMTPRVLKKMRTGQCYYIPAVDQNGKMLNDPVLLKFATDHYWVSISDSDLLLWALGLVAGAGLNVEVTEPDVSPLAVQGPKSDELMERVFGPEIRDIKFFEFGRFPFKGKSHVISRSGFSKQGGFEIYVDGFESGMPIWNALMTAGTDLDVRAGCPNFVERIESGLLTYGSDITREHNPYECGLERFCNPTEAVECLGPGRVAAR